MNIFRAIKKIKFKPSSKSLSYLHTCFASTAFVLFYYFIRVQSFSPEKIFYIYAEYKSVIEHVLMAFVISFLGAAAYEYIVKTD